MQEPEEEFVLALSAAEEGRCLGEVLGSPFGAGEPFPFALPWSGAELANLPGRVIEWVKAAEAAKTSGASDDEGGGLLAQLGGELSAALFASPAGSKLAASLHRLSVPGASHRRRALRLRLVFRGDPAAAARLAALPWELLRHPAVSGLLALGDRISIVRSPEIAAGTTIPGSLAVTLPLKVLLIGASSPDPKGDAQVEREQREIAAVSRVEVVDLDLFRGGTLADLRGLLQTHEFHVVHFMGHSFVEATSGERGLTFEDALGQRRYVTGPELAAVLRGLPSLRLVVLNSCGSASLAPALLAVGIPAVVGMQLPITHARAHDFSAQLYEDLTAGFPVETAIAFLRRATAPYTAQWLAPVVYLAGASSRLFDPGKLAVDPPPAEGTADGRLRLGVRSFIEKDDGHPPAFAKDMERESHRFLSLASSFNGRPIRQAALWESRIQPTLQRFLSEVAGERRPLLLDLAAHQTIAFTAGYYLGTNSGADIVVRQRGPRGTDVWHLEQGEVPEGPLWGQLKEEPCEGLAADCLDLALAVEISRGGVLEDVRDYLARAEPPLAVGRVLRASVPEPGQTSVRSGRHALRLAEELEAWVRRQSPHRERTIHLFAATPNGFLFLLGRLARNLGRIQLYEYGMGEPDDTLYSPSLSLPPKRFEPIPTAGGTA